MLLFSVISAKTLWRTSSRVVCVPRLRRLELCNFATHRPIERPGREPINLPVGLGVVELPFDGDIGVFDIRPSDPLPLPLGETRGQFLRLLVPLESDGEPQPAAVEDAIRRTEACLVWHRRFWRKAEPA